MERADEARERADSVAAARALERLLRLHPEDERAPLAAVTLGRLRLRQLGQPGEAARAFDRALGFGVADPVREDVYALRVEALSRAGRGEDADRAARDYRERYPHGRWSSEVRRWASVTDDP
jgi:hypothetical protein